MEESAKEYIRLLLNHIKELYCENEALKALFRTSPMPSLREQWKSALTLLMQAPEHRQVIDAKFDPHIEKIMRALDDQEAVASLLRTPTKGLPN